MFENDLGLSGIFKIFRKSFKMFQKNQSCVLHHLRIIWNPKSSRMYHIFRELFGLFDI